MKAVCYLRVGRGERRHQFAVSAAPSPVCLHEGRNPVPTVSFQLVLDIPDAAFEAGEVVIRVPLSELEIATEVNSP